MSDSVTQLQNQINTLCQLMFNYAGTLQRDAKPVRRPTRPTARMRDASREESTPCDTTDVADGADAQATIGPNGELNDALTEGGVTRAELDEMAATIAEASRVIMEIARALPEIDTDEEAARKRIAALHAEHDKVSEELDTLIAQAKTELDVVNAAFKAASCRVLALNDEATE